MSARLRNLITVFCISIAMWVGIISAVVGAYDLLAEPTTDQTVTASVR